MNEPEATGGSVARFYFAKDLPGAPVLYSSEKDGRRLRTATLWKHTPGT